MLFAFFSIIAHYDDFLISSPLYYYFISPLSMLPLLIFVTLRVCRCVDMLLLMIFRC